MGPTQCKITLGADYNFIYLREIFYNVKIMNGSVSKLITRNSQYLFSCEAFGDYINWIEGFLLLQIFQHTVLAILS